MLNNKELQKREKINPIKRVKDPVFCDNTVAQVENVYSYIIEGLADPCQIQCRLEYIQNSVDTTKDRFHTVNTCNIFLKETFKNRVKYMLNCVISALQFSINTFNDQSLLHLCFNSFETNKMLEQYPYTCIFEMSSYINNSDDYFIPYVYNDITRNDLILAIITLLNNNITFYSTEYDRSISEEQLISLSKIKDDIIAEIANMLNSMFNELLNEVKNSFSKNIVRQNIINKDNIDYEVPKYHQISLGYYDK